MEDQLSLLNCVPAWQCVLAHYAGADALAISTPVTTDQVVAGKQKNWLNRYEHSSQSSTELEDKFRKLTEDQVSQAHGILIALGLLEFDLVSRSDGIGYLLTSAGKKLLQNPDMADNELQTSEDHADAA